MISRKEKRNEEEQLPLTARSSPIHTKTQNRITIEKWVVSFMTALLVVSLLTDKIIHLIFDKSTGAVNFLEIETYFWLPSLFISDIIYTISIICLYKSASSWILRKEQSRSFKKRSSSASLSTSEFTFGSKSMSTKWFTTRNLLLLLYCAHSIISMVLVSVEVKNMIDLGEIMYWNMTFHVLGQWGAFQDMLKNKQDDGIMLWQIVVFQLFAAFLKRRFFQEMIDPTRIYRHFKKRRKGVYFGLLYILLVFVIRPAYPYNSLSDTPMIFIPREIASGISFGQQRVKKTNEFIPDLTTLYSKKSRPLNVVLILLETMRADMFPFDPSSPWAKSKNINASALVNGSTNKITPFYANWVKKPSTLYIPHMRAAAGFTHKALWSIFCSAYASPKSNTVEHLSNYYHECLPHVLENSGHGYKTHQFFKSITSSFDYQSELAANIGFEKMYGAREYNQEYKPSEEWEKAHRANYFGYEDDIILKPMMKWVDSRCEPFFLSYLSGTTHDPYDAPPSISWEKKTFTEDEKINNFLNDVAYTDRFLTKVIGEFEKRGLMNETLFVIMGDHGGNFKDREEKFTTLGQFSEEAFDIGVSFYSDNEEMSNILTNIANSGSVQNGIWSSIDIAPTILDLLGIFNPENATKLLNGKFNESIVDGRSMLHPSGKRLEFSIANPGNGMILKDGHYVILVPSRLSSFKMIRLYDLELDPHQDHPITLDDKNAKKGLIHWGKQAKKFLKLVESDLYLVHKTGKRCNNCALSLLKSLESLSQWDKYEKLHSSKDN